MEKYAAKYAADYANRVGDPFRAEELLCIPHEGVGPRDDLIVVPSDAYENSQSAITTITNSAEGRQTSFAVRNTALAVGDRLVEGLYKARKGYKDQLHSLHELWIKEGRQVNEIVAKQFVVARNVAKDIARDESRVPAIVYRVVDSFRSKQRVNMAPTEKIFLGRHKEAIESSFRSNKFANTAGVTIGGPIATMLRVGGGIAIGIDISAAMVAVYNAHTKEQQQASLEAFGVTVGSAAGLGVGGLLCGTMALTSGGLGLLGCGVVTGLASIAGEQVGGWVFGGNMASDLALRLRGPSQ